MTALFSFFPPVQCIITTRLVSSDLGDGRSHTLSFSRRMTGARDVNILLCRDVHQSVEHTIDSSGAPAELEAGRCAQKGRQGSSG
jgi:hypothetical protein